MPNQITLELPNTLIEQFKLDSGSLYLVKRDNEDKIEYGISVTKKDAIATIGSQYAALGQPAVLLLPGQQIQIIPSPAFSIPGALKFINCLLTFELKQQYSFGVIFLSETEELCLICKPILNPNKDCFILSTQGGYIPDQIRRCVYQLYIEHDKGIELDLKIDSRNAKIREWIKVWYNKLPQKGFHS